MTEFQKRLKKLMNEYVNYVYELTRKFPKEELYCSVSQWRRSSLSMVLNYIEGYARRKPLVQLNFLETAYGSFKESKYLLTFSYNQKFITENNYNRGLKLVEEIGAMLWTEITSLENRIKGAK